MSTTRIQFIISLILLIGYFILLGIILIAEVSDVINMQKGENSMHGELQILLGVLTAAVAQVFNFWFSKADDVVVPASGQAPVPQQV